MPEKIDIPQNTESGQPTTTGKGNKVSRALRLLGRILMPLAVLAAGVVISIWLFETSPKLRAQPRSHNRTLVTVKSVEYAPRQTLVSGMGSVAAAQSVELKPQVGGKIIELSKDMSPGTFFAKGSLLFKIDPAEYLLSVRQLSADVAKAESEIALEQGNQLIAQKEYKLLGQKLTEREKTLILRQPQLKGLQASLDAAQAKLDLARLDLNHTQVKAPFNAVVQSSDAHLGALADQSTQLATLVGTDAYWVKVSVPVSQLRFIKLPNQNGEKGSEALVYNSAAWGEAAFRKGRVIRLEPKLEEQGRMARLLIQVDDPLCIKPENAKLPSMLIDSYVRVAIKGKTIESAALVERKYIRNGSNVWIMNQKGNLEIRQVKTAFRSEKDFYVTGGIEPGEKLVLTDLSTPVSGMELCIRENGAGQTACRKAPDQEEQS